MLAGRLVQACREFRVAPRYRPPSIPAINLSSASCMTFFGLAVVIRHSKGSRSSLGREPMPSPWYRSPSLRRVRPDATRAAESANLFSANAARVFSPNGPSIHSGSGYSFSIETTASLSRSSAAIRAASASQAATRCRRARAWAMCPSISRTTSPTPGNSDLPSWRVKAFLAAPAMVSASASVRLQIAALVTATCFHAMATSPLGGNENCAAKRCFQRCRAPAKASRSAPSTSFTETKAPLTGLGVASRACAAVKTGGSPLTCSSWGSSWGLSLYARCTVIQVR